MSTSSKKDFSSFGDGTSTTTLIRANRGGNFVQVNTATEAAKVLVDTEVHAEDLHVSTRTSAIQLPSSIELWRDALSQTAKEIQRETGKTLREIESDIPTSLKVVDFVPPPSSLMKGKHRVTGSHEFKYQDQDGAVCGVFQPKVIGVNDSNQNQNQNQEEKNSEELLDDDDDPFSEKDHNKKKRKLCLPYELSHQDRFAYETLRQFWRESGRNFSNKQQQQQSTNAQVVATTSRIRGREQEQQNEKKNSAVDVIPPPPPPPPSSSSTSASTKNISSNQGKENEEENEEEEEDETAALLREAMEACARA